MKVLIVGQAPSQDTDGRPPFTGRSGARLADLLGVQHSALARTVDLVNLLDRWPGKNGKGDRFPIAEARSAARMLLAVAPHDRLILCGAQVARAFEIRDMRPLERRTVHGRVVLLLPHPSGVNLWWNDPDHAAHARRELRSFLSVDLRAAI